MSCCGSNKSSKSDAETIQDNVKEFYGKTVQKTSDLETGVCTLGSIKMPKFLREALSEVHEEVTSKYYGCGLVIPEQLEGMSVLDLGSGAGQDCFVLSKLVGESGSVTGVDMTDEQLEVANKYIDYHTKKFSYAKPNVNFVKGDIGKLGEVGLKDSSFDIIVSNCVVNLVPDKKPVLQEAFRVLKDGGEMYFSDVYADKDLPEEVRKHKVLWGECVSGALWWKDLISLSKDIGFRTPRLISSRTLDLKKEEFKQVVGDSKFVSAEYRLFKVSSQNNKPSRVTYTGGILGSENKFDFDHQWKFKTGESVIVPGEVVGILERSRYNKFFKIDLEANEVVQQATSTDDPFVLAGPSAGCCPTSDCCS